MWRPVLSAVFVAAGLVWLFAGMLRGPLVPPAAPPAGFPLIQETPVAALLPAAVGPFTIVLPKHTLPGETANGDTCGLPLDRPLGEVAEQDCPLAILLEQDVSSLSDADAVPTPPAAHRVTRHRPVRRAVAVAKEPTDDRSSQTQPDFTWRFPYDPSVGGAG